MITQPAYVLMPAVATEEMIRAGYGKDPGFGRLSAAIYAAMVAARPHPAGELREAVARCVYDFLDERFPDGALPGGVQLFADPGDRLDSEMKHEAGCDALADAIIALLNSAVEAPHSKEETS